MCYIMVTCIVYYRQRLFLAFVVQTNIPVNAIHCNISNILSIIYCITYWQVAALKYVLCVFVYVVTKALTSTGGRRRDTR